MQIAVLGPLRVVAGERTVPLTGLRRRALLARLALEPGTVVGFRTLAENLWPEEEPANPVPALQSVVSRLRRALPDDVVRSESAGYRLEIGVDEVDVTRFERLVREGRRLLRSAEPAVARDRLIRALELWRGQPLEEFEGFPFAAAASTRLRELWLTAVEDRIEAELTGVADPSEAPPSPVAELEQLIAEHPLRERLRALLIRALACDGRRPEALAAYESYRSLVADQLGTDPGPELRELHLGLLRDDTAGRPANGSSAPRPAAGDRRPERRGDLRAPLTSFVGREGERDRVRDRLRESRLVTLVGPGGVGKTRLALEAARSGGDGCLVELAAVSEADDVVRAAADAVGVRGTTNVPARLVEALSTGPVLLVLDGCEHLVGPVAELAEELLGRCPELRVLATSREPLGITGEALHPVGPLDQRSAARLFTERARAARPGLEAGDELDRICARLDGLPLAIELAAARLRSMPVEVLAARLDDRLGLLAGGSRTALPRHRTLRGVVAWSWELLTAEERAAAELASVFVSGFTAEAAERVGITEDALYALVDKSLLVTEAGRFRMLDTIAEYGIERLEERGGLLDARRAHAACYLALAETAEPWLRGAGQLRWLARLSDERDNLLAAFRFALDTADADTAVRLAAASSMFWALHGAHHEARRWIGQALRTPGPAPAEARTRAAAGYLLNALFAGELSEVELSTLPEPTPDGPIAAFVRAMSALAAGRPDEGMAALEPWLAVPDPWSRAILWLARSLLLHGAVATVQREQRDLQQAVSAFREAGERWGLALTLMSLASVHISEQGTDRTNGASEALAMLDEAVATTRELGTHDEQLVWLLMLRIDAGDPEGARAGLLRVLEAPQSPRQQAMARIPLADLARYDGDLAEARRQLELAGERDDPPYRTLYATAMGFLMVAESDLDAAERWFAEARLLAETMPDMPMLAEVTVGLADLSWRRGDPVRAAELLGLADVVRGGPNAGDPDVSRLARQLAPYAEHGLAASELEPADALARIRGIDP